MMKDIAITYYIDYEIKLLRIDFMSNGTGQIMLGKYYHGQVVFSQNQWRVYLNEKSELRNGEDIQTLIQILTERNEENQIRRKIVVITMTNPITSPQV